MLGIGSRSLLEVRQDALERLLGAGHGHPRQVHSGGACRPRAGDALRKTVTVARTANENNLHRTAPARMNDEVGSPGQRDHLEQVAIGRHLDVLGHLEDLVRGLGDIGPTHLRQVASGGRVPRQNFRQRRCWSQASEEQPSDCLCLDVADVVPTILPVWPRVILAGADMSAEQTPKFLRQGGKLIRSAARPVGRDQPA